MPRTITGRLLRPAALLSAVALAVSVAACGSADDPTTAAPAASSPGVPASSGVPAQVLAIRDPWVKAAEQGMTAAFATLVNNGDSDVTLTAASTDVSPVEIHEMSMKDGKMVMQARQGGLVIRAKSEHALEPGGDHLMLMKLARPVQAGEELTFTLTFADGRTQNFTATAKPFAGAQESYAPGHGEPVHAVSPTPGTSVSPAS